MLSVLHLAASRDLWSLGKNLATKAGTLLAIVAVIMAGAMILGHMREHRVGGIIVTVAIAAVALWFLTNPSGASHTLQSTIGSL